jgi:hypothetical protein
MSYGYDTYDNYPPYEYAQPPPKLDVHPNSAVAQLGLTPEEIREVSEEQERWFREEYQQELEEDRLYRARVSTEYQEQDHEVRRVPTPSITNSDLTPRAYEMPGKPPENGMSQYDDGALDPKLAPHLLYQPPTPIPDGADPTPQPGYSGYDMANEYGEHAVLLNGTRPMTVRTQSPNAMMRSSSSCTSSSSRTTQWGGGQGRWKGLDCHKVSMYRLHTPPAHPRPLLHHKTNHHPPLPSTYPLPLTMCPHPLATDPPTPVTRPDAPPSAPTPAPKITPDLDSPPTSSPSSRPLRRPSRALSALLRG